MISRILTAAVLLAHVPCIIGAGRGGLTITAGLRVRRRPPLSAACAGGLDAFCANASMLAGCYAAMRQADSELLGVQRKCSSHQTAAGYCTRLAVERRRPAASTSSNASSMATSAHIVVVVKTDDRSAAPLVLPDGEEDEQGDEDEASGLFEKELASWVPGLQPCGNASGHQQQHWTIGDPDGRIGLLLLGANHTTGAAARPSWWLAPDPAARSPCPDCLGVQLSRNQSAALRFECEHKWSPHCTLPCQPIGFP